MLSHQPEVIDLIHRDHVQQLTDDAQRPMRSVSLPVSRIRAAPRALPARRIRSRRLGATPSRRHRQIVMGFDAEAVARRLGLTETLIRRLRARGQLERCALSDAEIDRRLYEAHLAFVARNQGPAWIRTRDQRIMSLLLSP